LDLFGILIIKTGKQIMEDIRYIDDVSSLVLNQDKCIGCGLCTEVCPHNVFELRQGKAEIIDFNACMECGACVNNCPSNAIEVSPGVG
jgi:NAD-dependent dihydropyrimidine dehydrogenase PreA subunit